MSQESTRVSRWLASTLAGDSALVALVGTDPLVGAPAIYEDPGPQNGAYPRVTWYLHTPGADTRQTYGPRLMTTGTYLVKAIGKTESYLDLEAIMDRVDTLLDAAPPGTLASGISLGACWRVQAVQYPEVTAGVSFRHVGGLYKILVTP